MLRLLSPEHTIGRGYTITTTRNGKVVRSTGDVASGDELETRVRDGKVTSVVGAVPLAKANSETKRKPRK
jgi:exodeoxyribonuclease VII large subunit